MGLDLGYLINLKKSTIDRTEMEEICKLETGKSSNYWLSCMAEVSNRHIFSLGVVCSYKT